MRNILLRVLLRRQRNCRRKSTVIITGIYLLVGFGNERLIQLLAKDVVNANYGIASPLSADINSTDLRGVAVPTELGAVGLVNESTVDIHLGHNGKISVFVVYLIKL